MSSAWPQEYSDILTWTTEQLSKLEGDAIALPSFDSKLSWAIGSTAREVVLEKFPSQSVVIDVSLASGQVLFHAVSGNGTAPDNDDWVRRKRNVVIRFGSSSLSMGAKVRSKGKSMEEALYVLGKDYATHGGCVPIRVQGSDVIVATLTISGLAQTDDHLAALETLKRVKAAHK